MTVLVYTKQFRKIFVDLVIIKVQMLHVKKIRSISLLTG